MPDLGREAANLGEYSDEAKNDPEAPESEPEPSEAEPDPDQPELSPDEDDEPE